jgi:hypothetical protein
LGAAIFSVVISLGRRRLFSLHFSWALDIFIITISLKPLLSSLPPHPVGGEYLLYHLISSAAAIFYITIFLQRWISSLSLYLFGGSYLR